MLSVLYRIGVMSDHLLSMMNVWRVSSTNSIDFHEFEVDLRLYPKNTADYLVQLNQFDRKVLVKLFQNYDSMVLSIVVHH